MPKWFVCSTYTPNLSFAQPIILDKIDRKFIRPPVPPQKKKSRMGNGEPWLSLDFILDFGGIGVCCPILFCPWLRKVLDLSLSSRRSWSRTVSWFPLVFVKIWFWQNFTFSGFFLQLLLIVKRLDGFCLSKRQKNHPNLGTYKQFHVCSSPLVCWNENEAIANQGLICWRSVPSDLQAAGRQGLDPKVQIRTLSH